MSPVLRVLTVLFRTRSITMAQEALHAKDALAFAFHYSKDGTIHVDKTQRAFFNSVTEWKHDTAEIAMCAYRNSNVRVSHGCCVEGPLCIAQK